jgi:type I restriction enzyme M protein
LKAHDEAPFDLTIYGQEMDNATRAMAKMNMILHACPTAEIWRDNTLSSPHFKQTNGSLKTFDFVVANPPFSNKAWSNGFDPMNDELGRFVYGVPPKKNGDYAFLLHLIASLKSTGKGAVIMPHGVLFRGNVEADIRKRIIGRGFIKGIVGLPANLFYGTSIPACIIVVDKENANARTGIFMVDASKGFVKDGNKNRLRDQDIHKIVDAFTKRAEIDKYSRLVPLAEIAKHDFNLNIPRYIDSSEPEDLQDIEAHLKGGIPVRDIDALQPYWNVLSSVRGELFEPGNRPGYYAPKVGPDAVKPVILGHAEFADYDAKLAEIFAGWRNAHLERLKNLNIGDHPKQLIEAISEDLLIRFSKVALIDKYDVYQLLMTYWAEAMQDDAYVIAQEGWAAARQIRELVRNNEGKFTEEPDLTLGKKKLKAELIPTPLIVTRFFAGERAALKTLEAAVEEIARAIEEMDEEHGGEEGLLYEAKPDKGNEKGKVTEKSVKDRLRVIKHDPDAADERRLLEQCLALIEKEAEASHAAKETKAAFHTKTVAKYVKLSDAEVKALVVEDKWLARIEADVRGELDRVSQGLLGG